MSSQAAAYWRRKAPRGLMHHSDRGSPYAFQEHLGNCSNDAQWIRSMSRKADGWDKAVVEISFPSLKTEWIKDSLSSTREQARRDGGTFECGKRRSVLARAPISVLARR